MPFTAKDWRDAPGDLTTPISAAAMEDLEQRLSAYSDAAAAAAVAAATPPVRPATVAWTAAPAAPPGWLVANGTTVSRTTYAALYAELGGAASPHGQGNGSTTFTLPNLVDKFAAGSGGLYAMGSAGGAATVTLTTAEMPAHTHTGPSHTHTGAAHTHTTPAHAHALDYVGGAVVSGGVQIFQVSQPNAGTAYNTRSGGAGTSGSTASGASSASGTAATGSAGTGGAHANVPPYLALLPIIKT